MNRCVWRDAVPHDYAAPAALRQYHAPDSVGVHCSTVQLYVPVGSRKLPSYKATTTATTMFRPDKTAMPIDRANTARLAK